MPTPLSGPWDETDKWDLDGRWAVGQDDLGGHLQPW